jgi:hypothetical protein
MTDDALLGGIPGVPAVPRASRAKSISLSSSDTVATIGVFLYWVVFEHIVFFHAEAFGGTLFLAVTNALKLGLPLALLAYTGLPATRVLLRGLSSLYITLFLAFLAWASIPTLISGNPIDYLKFLPRFVFFLSVLAFFANRPAAISLFAKFLVAYVLLALAQFVILYSTRGYDRPTVAALGITFAGPLGLLGNISGRFYLPGVSVPIVRLAGFWNEPTHAAASAFAGFFLARYLANSSGKRAWRWASRGCLVAGFLTLSNAGYLALGAALLFGLLFGGGRLTVRRTLHVGVLLPVAAALIAVALVGRYYVASNLYGNLWARAIAGMRGDEQLIDPTSGRIELVTYTLTAVNSTVIGAGIQVWGEGGIRTSSSAPLLWLLLTGVPGLVLILARESVLMLAARSAVSRARETLPVAQALIVVVVQQLAYGSWMDANYFCLAAAVLVLGRAAPRAAAR